MSYMNLDALSPREMIAQYILLCRAKGVCLNYSEYELVDIWLEASRGDSQVLLLILADILPNYFAKGSSSHLPRPLAPLHKTIMRRIRELASLAPL